MPREREGWKSMTLYLPTADMDALEAQQAATGETAASFVRRAVQRALREVKAREARLQRAAERAVKP